MRRSGLVCIAMFQLSIMLRAFYQIVLLSESTLVRSTNDEPIGLHVATVHGTYHVLSGTCSDAIACTKTDLTCCVANKYCLLHDLQCRCDFIRHALCLTT